MQTRRLFAVALAACLAAAPARAQFTGPSGAGALTTVAGAQTVRQGTYVTLEGTIVAHLHEDYYLFADSTGQMRVEIEPGTFAGQRIDQQTRVRLFGEVDMEPAGGAAGRYLWVETLTRL